MPNRVLRDWTDSDRVNALSAEGERLFTRLIMKADDYGRYFADPKRLKSYLFPLNDQVAEVDLARWLDECEQVGLLRRYEISGKRYLEVLRFGQRLRNMRNVHPSPEPVPIFDVTAVDMATRGDSPPSAAPDRPAPPESEVESESEPETEGKGNVPPHAVLPEPSAERLAELPTVEQAIAQAATSGIPPDFVRYVYADWSSRSGRDAAGNPVSWLPYITKRWLREQVEWRSGTHRGRKAAPTTRPPRPPGTPTPAEVQAYAREKWADQSDWLLWAVQFHHYWNDPKRHWQRQGQVIDWKIELGKWVASQRKN